VVEVVMVYAVVAEEVHMTGYATAKLVAREGVCRNVKMKKELKLEVGNDIPVAEWAESLHPPRQLPQSVELVE
jgi:hypothetical protein